MAGTQKFHKSFAVACLAVGIALTLLLTGWLVQLNAERNKARLNEITDSIQRELLESFSLATYGLGGANGVFVASKSVEYQEFKNYVASRDLKIEFPSVLGFGYIQRVERSRIEEFVNEVREDGQPDFQVHPEGKSSDLFVIKYIFPEDVNSQAIGFDIGSEVRRRDAAEHAMLTGRPTLTRPIKLVQAMPADSVGFLYLRPVYKSGADISTEVQKRRNLEGWVYTPIVLNKIVAPIIEQFDKFAELVIYESEAGAGNSLMYGSLASAGKESRRVRIDIGQRQWELLVRPTEYFYTLNPYRLEPLVALLSGLLVSILASYLTFHRLLSSSDSYERVIRDRESFLEQILRDVNLSVIATDSTGTIKVFNNTSMEWLKYRPEEVIGKVRASFFIEGAGNSGDGTPDQQLREIVGDRFQNLSLNSLPKRFETNLIAKNGERIPVLISLSAIFDTEKHAIGYLIVADNLTEKRRSEELFYASFMQSPQGFALLDQSLTFTTVNQALCSLLGYSPDVLIGKGAGDLRFEKTDASELEQMQSLVRGKISSLNFETRYLKSDRNPIWVKQSISRVADSTGNAEFFICHIEDIQGSKEHEVLLEKQTQQLNFYKYAIDASSIVGITNQRGRLTYVNEKFCEISKFSQEELLGATHGIVNSGYHPPEFFRALWDNISAGKLWRGDIKNRAKDGTYYWVDATIVPVAGDDGKPQQYFSIHRDISTQKSYEVELKSQSEQLEEARNAALLATKAKGEFLANMSHEIRTPLTSIIGYSESLLIDQLDVQERKVALETIIRNGNHLLGVINDILDLSKIESGKMSIEILEVNPMQLIGDVMNILRPKAFEKGLSFGVEYQYPIPKSIQSDPVKLKQILINLAGNAIKFTTQGGVKIRVSFLREIERLIFDVVDTGPGMTEEARGRLFKAFSQGDTSVTRKFGGTGLGLVISNMLALRLGGEIRVESRVGIGSSFTLTTATGSIDDGMLVFSELSDGAELSAPSSGKQTQLQGTVLLVDDGSDNQMLVSRLLERLGLKVAIAGNGALAIDAVNNEQFDLIFMDIQMPVMDGYTATKQLRASGFRLPIVALTGNAMAEDRQLAMAAGCSDFVGKPFRRSELIAVLEKYLRRAQYS